MSYGIQNRWRTSFAYVLLAGALIGFLIFSLRGCSDEERSYETLDKAGFDQIELGGPDRWSCGGGDYFSNTFTARNSKGSVVNGVVCCGLYKGCTIRF